MRIARLATALATVFVLSSAVSARADDPMFGVRIGAYTDAGDPFIGGEMLFKLAPRIYFNPNVEAVLVDHGHFFTINADAHYDLPTHSRAMVWVGGGLAIINASGGGESNTDLGVNLLGGVGVRTGRVIPYAQAKVIIKDGSELVIGVGLRF